MTGVAYGKGGVRLVMDRRGILQLYQQLLRLIGHELFNHPSYSHSFNELQRYIAKIERDIIPDPDPAHAPNYYRIHSEILHWMARDPAVIEIKILTASAVRRAKNEARLAQETQRRRSIQKARKEDEESQRQKKLERQKQHQKEKLREQDERKRLRLETLKAENRRREERLRPEPSPAVKLGITEIEFQRRLSALKSWIR